MDMYSFQKCYLLIKIFPLIFQALQLLFVNLFAFEINLQAQTFFSKDLYFCTN